MLPSPAHIVSDLHLGASPPDVERRFVAFLDHLRGEGGTLVVNGDLFDFWFEWRTVIPRVGFRALAALSRVRDSGMPVLWLAGNHDCWGGDMLREDVGVQFVDEWRGNLAGWESWLHHGDGLREVEDRRYRRLRRVLRHPWSVRAFRWIHPDISSRVATGSSHASRRHRAHDEGSGLRSVAFERLSADPSLRLVVFGHSHVPSLVTAPSGGVYANAGSWLDEPTYLRVTPQRIELRRLLTVPTTLAGSVMTTPGIVSAQGASLQSERLHALDRPAQEALAQS